MKTMSNLENWWLLYVAAKVSLNLYNAIVMISELTGQQPSAYK